MSKWKIELITIDDLSLLAEEEIADRISKCRSEMGKRVGDLKWRQLWETELAYAQRELQIRHGRRRRHQEYVERERAAEVKFLAEEDTLPEYEGNRIPRYVKEIYGWN